MIFFLIILYNELETLHLSIELNWKKRLSNLDLKLK